MCRGYYVHFVLITFSRNILPIKASESHTDFHRFGAIPLTRLGLRCRIGSVKIRTRKRYSILTQKHIFKTSLRMSLFNQSGLNSFGLKLVKLLKAIIRIPFNMSIFRTGVSTRQRKSINDTILKSKMVAPDCETEKMVQISHNMGISESEWHSQNGNRCPSTFFKSNMVNSAFWKTQANYQILSSMGNPIWRLPVVGKFRRIIKHPPIRVFLITLPDT